MFIAYILQILDLFLIASTFHQKISHLTPNIYNFNKKKFLLDIYYFRKYIISIKHLFNRKILKINQDDSRKFIFLFTIIYVNKTVLAFDLIY